MSLGVTYKYNIANKSLNDPPDAEWIKTFGGSENDHGYCVRQTNDGGYIIAGYTRSYGNNGDMWVIKTDMEGNEEWNKTYGGAERDVGLAIYRTYDGGYIITGYTYSYGYGGFGSDLWLVKIDTNGNEEWNKTYGGADTDGGRSVQQTTDGGYIITGYSHSYPAIDATWIIKTDSSGNIQWQRIYENPSESLIGRSAVQTSDEGYIFVTAFSPSHTQGKDAFLVKLDVNGNEEWNKTYGGAGWEDGREVQQAPDGGYIFTGGSSSYSVTYNRNDVWLVKTDINGNEEWNRTYGGLNHDYGYSMQKTTYGGYIITGLTDSFGAGEFDVWLIKTDNDGNKLWDKTFGGSQREMAESVQQTTDNGYIITGVTKPYGEDRFDVLLIKAVDFENQRPTKLIITGPTNGKIYEDIEFTIVSTDPDGDDLNYYVNWGEYDDKEWFGPYSSGNPINVSHMFLWDGTHTIRVKVEDIHGGESDWNEFKIRISNPRTRAWLRFFDMFPILQKILNYIL
jgi:hypothetical protein